MPILGEFSAGLASSHADPGTAQIGRVKDNLLGPEFALTLTFVSTLSASPHPRVTEPVNLRRAGKSALSELGVHGLRPRF